ncbi:MAG TPA: helix-turn-helix domain-containing protein [Thermoanaerobaculia bacterium]|jgi:SOS-response transcriptional repressor LexA|nr:helix-turn-helix domain-containing protein [Thermoanaerobaculia bacterium]
MLGETVREARIRKNLTQARLAKLAGVSRRHLAALEKGANVSVNILQRVAQVLELTEIQIGDLSLRSNEADRHVNYPLLTDTIREARAEAERAQAILARAENLLGGRSSDPQFEATFPRMPVRRIEAQREPSADMLRERPDWTEIEIAGEIRHGQPIDESKKEKIAVPKSLVEEGEIVFRARGDSLHDQGIHDGDLLIVELRPRGRASSGELVIGRIGKQVFIGRWWQKHGMKALMSNGLSEVTVGRSARSLKVVAAINQIIRV